MRAGSILYKLSKELKVKDINGFEINRNLFQLAKVFNKTATLKNEYFFNKSAQNLIKRNEKINGEFYVDSCINEAISLGYKCHVFYVNHYLCWGTPNDLKTFEYWQSCFHKYHNHPYVYERDMFKSNSENNSYPEHILEKNPAFLRI